MSNPRLIATTASAALIAGVGAGAAVYAVDILTAGDNTITVADAQEQSTPTLQQPRDERTAVYVSPSDDDDDDEEEGGGFQPAPKDTQWNNGASQQGTQNKSNTSKSS